MEAPDTVEAALDRIEGGDALAAEAFFRHVHADLRAAAATAPAWLRRAPGGR